MMGCAGSKSTPVVEANTDVIKNGLNSNGTTLMQKVEEIVDDAKEMVTECKYTDRLEKMLTNYQQ